MYTYQDVDKISLLLLNNEILAIPTDTVYGIMALASKENEIKINNLKGSSLDKKLSLIFFDVDTLLSKIDYSKTYNVDLISKYLPGKYTFIVHLKEEFYKLFNRSDFGVRVTSNNNLQNLIKRTGPLLATSCNKSGKEICTNPTEIRQDFADLNIVIDEMSQTELSSTIIDLTNNEPRTIR